MTVQNKLGGFFGLFCALVSQFLQLSFLGFCLSPVLQLMRSRLMQVTGNYLRTILRMMNWKVLSVLCCCVMG